MPARPHDPTRPTVYLDWSTFVYAFNAGTLGSREQRAGLVGLVPLLHETATEANLVFSQLHLSELAAWGDVAAARGAAAWLDGLPLVWARFWPHVQSSEDEYWVKVIAGCTDLEPVRVFAPSMLATLESLSVGQVAEVLRTPTLGAVFEIERRDGAIAAGVAQNTLQWAGVAHHDRRAVAERQASAEEIAALKERAASQLRTLLRQRALAAHKRLLTSHTEYAAKNPSLNDVLDPFVSAFQTNPAALPLSKVFDRLAQGFIDTAARRTPESRKFGNLDSSGLDIFHALIGAAYCTLFTCDQLTAQWLGDIRPNLGLPPPVVFSDGGATFVAQLGAAWHAVR